MVLVHQTGNLPLYNWALHGAITSHIRGNTLLLLLHDNLLKQTKYSIGLFKANRPV